MVLRAAPWPLTTSARSIGSRASGIFVIRFLRPPTGEARFAWLFVGLIPMVWRRQRDGAR
jgi:hypothetical protein